MSRAELAEAANCWLYEQTRETFAVDANQIGKYERGENRWPRRHYRQALCAVLNVARPAGLGFYPCRQPTTPLVPPQRTPCTDQEMAFDPPASWNLAGDDDVGDTDHHESSRCEPPGQRERSTDDAMRRRTLLGLSAGALFTAAISPGVGEPDEAPDLVTALTSHDEPTDSEPIALNVLVAAVAKAKRRYQACEYQQVITALPALMGQLRTACRGLDGDERLRAYALAADTYQVAGSILIKHGDIGLATLAADRSVRAAIRSNDPLAVGASARIVTHTLMSGGHLRHAARTAITAAERLTDDGPATPQSLSVTGALLLRGSLAAARGGDRDTTTRLLDEATAVAQHLGLDANERWTAFGPTNVLLHRVSAAVSLGDAGNAIAYAQRIPLDKVVLAERRACLFVDVARALAAWGKPERAHQALLAAERTAPEEIRTRPAVRHLVDDLVRRVPHSLYPEVRDLADRIGAGR